MGAYFLITLAVCTTYLGKPTKYAWCFLVLKLVTQYVGYKLSFKSGAIRTFVGVILCNIVSILVTYFDMFIYLYLHDKHRYDYRLLYTPIDHLMIPMVISGLVTFAIEITLTSLVEFIIFTLVCSIKITRSKIKIWNKELFKVVNFVKIWSAIATSYLVSHIYLSIYMGVIKSRS